MKNHSLSSRFTRLGLAVIMLFALLGAAVAPAGQAAAAQAGVTSAPAVSALPASEAASVTAAVYATAEFMLKNGVQSDWQAIGLAQAGYKVPASYLKALEGKVAEAKGFLPELRTMPGSRLPLRHWAATRRMWQAIT